jgi:tetratricopeptide (TPR) repeat protein
VAGCVTPVVVLAPPAVANAVRDTDDAVCRSQDHVAAIEACTRLIEALPAAASPLTRSRLHQSRGASHEALDNLDAALADLDRAIGLDPENGRAFSTRSWVHTRNGNLDAALADGDRAVVLLPNCACSHNNRGLALHNKERYREAVEVFDAALKVDPRFYFALNNRGRSLTQLNQLDRAERDLRAALALKADYAPPHVNLGLIALRRGQRDRAIQAFTKAIERNPNLQSAYNERGLVRMERREWALAARDFAQASAIAPRWIFPRNNWGNALREAGDLVGAIRQYDLALQLDPGFSVAYANRGLAYERLKDLDRARADFRQARDRPLKYSNGPWAQNTARQRLAAIGDRPPARPIPPAPVQEIPAPVVLRVARPVVAANAPPAAAPAAPDAPVLRLPSPPEAATPQTVPPSVGAAGAGPMAAIQRAVAAARGARVALVIGNGAYGGATPLPNPPRDADAVAEALQRLGFASVMIKHNLSRQAMLSVLRDFSAMAAMADWAVVYFAGHGVEIDGRNFLIPVDSALKRDIDVQDEAIAIERVRQEIAGANKLRLVIIDACRDNPFVPKMARSGAVTRSVGRGLAVVEAERPGDVTFFAARAGTVAEDGEGGNSPFAAALVRQLQRPNIDINRLFRAVRDDVMRATAGRQQPFEYASLPDEDFIFNEGQRAAR